MKQLARCYAFDKGMAWEDERGSISDRHLRLHSNSQVLFLWPFDRAQQLSPSSIFDAVLTEPEFSVYFVMMRPHCKCVQLVFCQRAHTGAWVQWWKLTSVATGRTQSAQWSGESWSCLVWRSLWKARNRLPRCDSSDGKMADILFPHSFWAARN